ncbi:septal ring lytic transglycosylase RlpA family protein [Sphingomonas bacterium]|uniref:septal ring lytic transglycosylase RlpA family protein n=1 Tax=Sphingomonas bacterium TaxID=1895847 RepID=UPI00157532BB|nr:septal ring lytic transglycosylase RlpA family protein [Sphingomonas bacterium]
MKSCADRASRGIVALAALGSALGGCAGPSHHLVADTPVKIGRPYQVRGTWYSPADDPSYDETGLASWYGPKGQHGATANGERFDGRRVGAAHKTLPLPSYVEVTVLASGRRVIVRVNDRGPFVANRIIDLSYGAAELLGITRAGVARVRVRRVFPGDSVRRALRSGRPAMALPSVSDTAPNAVETLARARGPSYPAPDPVSEQRTSPTP